MKNSLDFGNFLLSEDKKHLDEFKDLQNLLKYYFEYHIEIEFYHRNLKKVYWTTKTFARSAVISQDSNYVSYVRIPK